MIYLAGQLKGLPPYDDKWTVCGLILMVECVFLQQNPKVTIRLRYEYTAYIHCNLCQYCMTVWLTDLFC